MGRLFAFLSATSLVVLVATCVLWVRSGYRQDDVRVTTFHRRFWHAHSANGRLCVETYENWPVYEPFLWRSARPDGHAESAPRIRLSGIDAFPDAGWWSSDGTGGSEGTGRTLYRPDGQPPTIGRWRDEGHSPPFVHTNPLRFRERTWKHATIAMWLSLLPAVWLVAAAWRRGREMSRRMDGRCHACGYDLRATPGRCPECGVMPSAATST